MGYSLSVCTARVRALCNRFRERNRLHERDSQGKNGARRSWEAVRAQTHSHTGRVCIVICEHRGGMAATVPTQDLPPAGGFEPIRYKRNLPQRGPPGFIFFLVGGTAIIYGLYKVGEGNHKNWYGLRLKKGNWRRTASAVEERKSETHSSWKRSFSQCSGRFFSLVTVTSKSADHAPFRSVLAPISRTQLRILFRVCKFTLHPSVLHRLTPVLRPFPSRLLPSLLFSHPRPSLLFSHPHPPLLSFFRSLSSFCFFVRAQLSGL